MPTEMKRRWVSNQHHHPISHVYFLLMVKCYVKALIADVGKVGDIYQKNKQQTTSRERDLTDV